MQTFLRNIGIGTLATIEPLNARVNYVMTASETSGALQPYFFRND